MTETRMGHFMGDDRLDRAHISLYGDKVATGRTNIHPAAEREFAAVRIIVGDIIVVAICVVKHDQKILAPLRRLGNAVQHGTYSLQGPLHVFERDLGQLWIERRQDSRGITFLQMKCCPKRLAKMKKPGALTA